MANSARCLGSLLWEGNIDDSNGVVRDKRDVPREQLGLEARETGNLRLEGGDYAEGVGPSSESDGG